MQLRYRSVRFFKCFFIIKRADDGKTVSRDKMFKIVKTGRKLVGMLVRLYVEWEGEGRGLLRLPNDS